jgi:hypothetical protein
VSVLLSETQIPIKSRTNMSATDSKSEYAPVATVDEKSKLEKMELDETKVTNNFSVFLPHQ